jgi:hypothetical protein
MQLAGKVVLVTGAQQVIGLWRDCCQEGFRRGRGHRPRLAQFHWYVPGKKGTPIPKNIEVWVYLLEVDKTLSNWPEKKHVRLDGYHVKSLLGSSVNRCSPIFVTALRRARATVDEVAPQRRRSAAGMTAIGFREESRCSPGIDRPRRGAGHRRHARTGDRYGEAGLSSQRSEMSLPAERPNPI